MKVKIPSLYKSLIILFLLIENCCFYLVESPGILSAYMSFYIKTLAGIVAAGFFLVTICIYRFRKKLYIFASFPKWYCLLYLVGITYVILGTVFEYNESFISTFLTASVYFIPLLYIPILVAFSDSVDPDELLKVLNVFTLIWYILIISQEFMYDKGYVFLRLLEKGVSFRNNRLRMELSPFGNMMLIYNFYVVLYQKYKSKPINNLNLLLGLFALFYIQQTRSMIVIVMGVFCYFVATENSSYSRLLKNILICIMGGIAVLKTGYLDRFIATFSDAEYAGSGIAREYANAYYLSMFLKNPTIGLGFTSDLSMLRGNRGIAYIDDVGLIGQMARLGIVAFVVLVPLVFRWIKIAIFMKKEDGTRLYFGFLFYFLATSATLMILDSQRIALLPFLIAVFELAYTGKICLKRN